MKGQVDLSVLTTSFLDKHQRASVCGTRATALEEVFGKHKSGRIGGDHFYP